LSCGLAKVCCTIEDGGRITKATFKELYFKYATSHSGWTSDYWNKFYEQEEGKRYFFATPETPQSTRMFIVSDHDSHRMVFLTEEAEESFFDFPDER
jgi:hypothetical protein